MAKRGKMVIIGLDSISMSVLDQILARGYCPTLKRLIANGCYGLGRSFCSVETGTNWAVLATGASPAITGVHMQMRLPGMRLNETMRGFPSELIRAEQIWNAAGRSGKRSVIFDYPGSFPVNCDGAIHVGEDGRPGQSIRALSEMHGYRSSGLYREDGEQQSQIMSKIAPAPATGWANLPKFPQTPLAVELEVKPWPASRYKRVSSLHALLVPEGGKGYASVAFFSKKDYATKLGEVRKGQWSDWLINDFETDLGVARAATHAKLFDLSPDGKDVHIYLHEIYPTGDFAHPKDIHSRLLEKCGPYYPHTCRQQAVNSGAADVWTFLEEVKWTAGWYRKAMGEVLGREPWDLFIQKWHPPDFAYHFGAFMIDKRHPLYDPKRDKEGWDYWGAVMNEGDQLVKTAMEYAGDGAIVAVMSDHGGKMVYPGAGGHASWADVLKKAGLVAVDEAGRVDWSRTRAWFGGEHFVWVNLKGRDPEGVVEPGAEYEAVRQQIIDAVLDAKDAETGQHRANLVCRVEDAAMVGIGGPQAGDVFVWHEEGPPLRAWTKDEFERAHPGVKLGSWEWPRQNSGNHRPDPFMIMCGPGLKKGYRRDRAAWVNCFAPTLATAWGIPVPKDADGAAIWDFLG